MNENKKKYRLILVIESYNIERLNRIVKIANEFTFMSEVKEETLKEIEK